MLIGLHGLQNPALMMGPEMFLILHLISRGQGARNDITWHLPGNGTSGWCPES